MITELISGGVGFGTGFAISSFMRAKLSLPEDVQIQINRLAFVDTGTGAGMPVKTVFSHLQMGDWDEWVVGFGYSPGESQVIARVGRNNLTGEISAGVAKFGSNSVEVYLDGALFGTLVEYTAVGTAFAGWIGVTLVAPP